MSNPSIGHALGKISSGLYIATAKIDGVPLGMLCSFVEQAGFEPPMISIALGPTRPIVTAFEGDGRFGLHILSEDDKPLLKAFARGDNLAAFSELARVENVHGIPQFADAWAFLACKVVGQIAAGDHTLFLAEVIDGVLQREKAEPMIRVRANGFSY